MIIYHSNQMFPPADLCAQGKNLIPKGQMSLCFLWYRATFLQNTRSRPLTILLCYISGVLISMFLFSFVLKSSLFLWLKSSFCHTVTSFPLARSWILFFLQQHKSSFVCSLSYCKFAIFFLLPTLFYGFSFKWIYTNCVTETVISRYEDTKKYASNFQSKDGCPMKLFNLSWEQGAGLPAIVHTNNVWLY